ncbi:hypothetical protein ACLOJK_030265 [Asimina triloba]
MSHSAGHRCPSFARVSLLALGPFFSGDEGKGEKFLHGVREPCNLRLTTGILELDG